MKFYGGREVTDILENVLSLSMEYCNNTTLGRWADYILLQDSPQSPRGPHSVVGGVRHVGLMQRFGASSWS